MNPNFSLAPGFHAVVIGGAGDIGAAISNQFCDLGATVTATGANEADLSRTLLKPRAGLTLATLDVTDDAAVTSFARKHRRVDALINCAGILARDKEFEIETFMKVLDVNLTGTFRTCMAFHPLLAEQTGSIVNIASMNATLALPRIPAYCASKGGVVMLTKALALKWAEEGIRVNAVAPGYIETAINAAGRGDLAHYQRIADRTAFKRWGQPEDIAFLCMPASQYATGTVVAVDGGFLAG
ncbi:SDR family oxidoreductase [Bradyrhizobium barranii subsp. barranii]|uniref:SDR family oxidoreductase n=1 Tax=Bradyrhizobium barranii subsp. barranii TaxID=2823807 RepID=A0A7Z0QEL0_9BRAD|nr:SDR family oxidoreductase [Bradyrhizobium barranii]UGX92170.1 SDR family oxidoreductase [Bradyrhizobium barranii subsp. barranii]